MALELSRTAASTLLPPCFGSQPFPLSSSTVPVRFLWPASWQGKHQRVAAGGGGIALKQVEVGGDSLVLFKVEAREQ